MRNEQQDLPAKLLIVDDDPSIRALLSEVLTEIGFSVRSAEDRFSALAEIRKEIPDIPLSDLNMPDMSGFESLSVGPPPLSLDSGNRDEWRILRG